MGFLSGFSKVGFVENYGLYLSKVIVIVIRINFHNLRKPFSWTVIIPVCFIRLCSLIFNPIELVLN